MLFRTGEWWIGDDYIGPNVVFTSILPQEKFPRGGRGGTHNPQAPGWDTASILLCSRLCHFRFKLHHLIKPFCVCAFTRLCNLIGHIQGQHNCDEPYVWHKYHPIFGDKTPICLKVCLLEGAKVIVSHWKWTPPICQILAPVYHKGAIPLPKILYFWSSHPWRTSVQTLMTLLAREPATQRQIIIIIITRAEVICH